MNGCRQNESAKSSPINDGLESCGYLWISGLVDVKFYHCLDFILTAPIYCRDPLVSKFALMNIKLINLLDGLKVSSFSANFHFWGNYPLTTL